MAAGHVVSKNDQDLSTSREASENSPADTAGYVATSSPSAGGALPLTPEAQQAVRKERRDRARETKLAQTQKKGISGHHQQQQHQHQEKPAGGGGGSKRRRWGPGQRGGKGRNKAKSKGGCAAAGGEMEAETPDVFDRWLGVQLTAWTEGGESAQPGVEGYLVRPPTDSGVSEEIDFDPAKDEIAFPACLSALQRRQVHGWAMQLALFHASSGEDHQRHVIISKTGDFQGKVLTRGGNMWYKKGVTAPVVKRFALQPGHEAIVEPLLTALHSFHERVQLRKPGFEQWLEANVSPAILSDGSEEVEKAEEAFSKWPLLQEVEYEYVDTPEQLCALVEVLNASKEWGFDLEAHNARSFHGLSCLLQISTEAKDYIVDVLAEGMWDSISLLRGPFANPDVVKIGHSIRSMDVPSLYRDFGIVLVNAVDTEEAVHALGEKRSGLASVLLSAGLREEHDIAGIKQTMQACDWRERPLSPEMLMYSRCDSHYLIPLWHLLRARLLAADTFSNREAAREEKQLQEIKRRLDEHQRRKEEAAFQRHFASDFPLLEGAGSGVLSINGATARLANHHAGLPSSAAQVGRSPAMSPRRSPLRSGSNSPSAQQLAQEPWMSEWDDPEDRHRRERSRSGSFFRPDLESIQESSRNSTFGAGLQSALTAAFREDEDDEEHVDQVMEAAGGADAAQSAIGNGNVHHVGDLGESLMWDGGDGGLAEVQREYKGGGEDEDEDEDLWEGWGEDTNSSAGDAVLGASGDCVSRGETHSLTGEDEAHAVAAIPLSGPIPMTRIASPPAYPMSNGAASLPSNLVVSALANGVSAGKGSGSANSPPKTGAAAAMTTDAEPIVQEPDGIVLTDGIRLLWKTLSRTQVTTTILWHPAREATREDSHNERHFRTAVQRLKPPRWTDSNVRVYEDIYVWRDKTARRLDDGVAYVCPGDILIDIALAMPKTLGDLRRVSSPLSPVLGHADTEEAAELVRVVRVGLGLPAEEDEGEGGRIHGGIIAKCVAVGGGYVKPAIALTVVTAVALGVVIAISKRRRL